MAGMAEVGRLFNNNELIVAEVLQSAEAMKAAVNHLEQFMEKADTAARGKVVLATVKGDVHDIGKNLVEIILANNGYTVVNLGIKVAPDVLIQRVSRAQAGRDRTSGLLVKSTQQMVITAKDLKAAGYRVPLWSAGGALGEIHAEEDRAGLRRAVCYAKDAMTGLSLMNRHHGSGERETVLAQHVHRSAGALRAGAGAGGPLTTRRSGKSARTFRFPPLRTWSASARRAAPGGSVELHQPLHALRQESGLQGQFRKELAEHDPKALDLHPQDGRGEAGGRAAS